MPRSFFDALDAPPNFNCTCSRNTKGVLVLHPTCPMHGRAERGLSPEPFVPLPQCRCRQDPRTASMQVLANCPEHGAWVPSERYFVEVSDLACAAAGGLLRALQTCYPNQPQINAEIKAKREAEAKAKPRVVVDDQTGQLGINGAWVSTPSDRMGDPIDDATRQMSGFNDAIRGFDVASGPEYTAVTVRYGSMLQCRERVVDNVAVARWGLRELEISDAAIRTSRLAAQRAMDALRRRPRVADPEPEPAPQGTWQRPTRVIDVGED